MLLFTFRVAPVGQKKERFPPEISSKNGQCHRRWPKALLLSETLVFFSAPNGIIDALEHGNLAGAPNLAKDSLQWCYINRGFRQTHLYI
jgi:hypothetical protein